MIVGEADLGHRLIVVGLGAKGVGQDWDIDERGEQGDDVSGEHGIALGTRSDFPTLFTKRARR